MKQGPGEIAKWMSTVILAVLVKPGKLECFAVIWLVNFKVKTHQQGNVNECWKTLWRDLSF